MSAPTARSDAWQAKLIELLDADIGGDQGRIEGAAEVADQVRGDHAELSSLAANRATA
jgi:hypothetical protein